MNKDKVAVLTDSGGDIPKALLERYGIYQIPLRILYRDREYLDGVNISANTVYAMLPVEIPKTSLPDGAMIQSVFDRIKADGYEKVLVVCISSGLSGTCNVMKILGDAYEGLECFVLDTKTFPSEAVFRFASGTVSGAGNGLGRIAAKDARRAPQQPRLFLCENLGIFAEGWTDRLGCGGIWNGAQLKAGDLLQCRWDLLYGREGAWTDAVHPQNRNPCAANGWR